MIKNNMRVFILLLLTVSFIIGNAAYANDENILSIDNNSFNDTNSIQEDSVSDFSDNYVEDETVIDNSTQTTSSLNDENLGTNSNTNSYTESPKYSNNSIENFAAGGDTPDNNASTPSTQTTFSIAKIKDASKRVFDYYTKNKVLPNYVLIDNIEVNMDSFLYLSSKAVLNINSKSYSSVLLKDFDSAPKPYNEFKNGDLNKVDYIKTLTNLVNYMDANKRVPNYVVTSLGKIGGNTNLVTSIARIVNFHTDKNYLPNYVSMTNLESSSVQPPSGNTNPSVDTSSVKALSESLCKNETSDLQKAKNIFYWVRDNVDYSFYYNSKYYSNGTLKYLKGNCCDQARLVVDLLRYASISAEFVHGTCTFSSGNVYGHVWTRVSIGGVNYILDTTSSRNEFNVVKNWNTATYKLKGTYENLPF